MSGRLPTGAPAQSYSGVTHLVDVGEDGLLHDGVERVVVLLVVPPAPHARLASVHDGAGGVAAAGAYLGHGIRWCVWVVSGMTFIGVGAWVGGMAFVGVGE